MNEENGESILSSLWRILDFMPEEQLGEWAQDVDWINNLISNISLFCTIAIVGTMLYFAVRYRRRSDNDETPYITHSATIETVWTVIPSIICVIIFVYGINVYSDMRQPPLNPLEIHVTGRKWAWSFLHENGKRDAQTLVVPIGKPVRLIMKSTDVIHSFFIPAMRLKEDVMPQKYNYKWFTADKLGEYRIFCTEYCGKEHWNMLGTLKVVTASEYEDYLLDRGKEQLSPVELGKQLYAKQACNSCHSLDGSPMVGPSFKGVYESQRTFSDGSQAMADENYLRESILNSAAKIVQGYQPVMPSFQGQLSDEEVQGLIAFIKEQK